MLLRQLVHETARDDSVISTPGKDVHVPSRSTVASTCNILKCITWNINRLQKHKATLCQLMYPAFRKSELVLIMQKNRDAYNMED